MRTFNQCLLIFLASCYFTFVTGCSGQKTEKNLATETHDDHHHDHDHDHDHDHHHGSAKRIDASAAGLNTDSLVTLDEPDLPETFPDAVKQLQSMRDTIRDGLGGDNHAASHDALHDIGNLLGRLEELVANASFDDAQKKQAKHAVASLFEDFDSVDAKLHGAEGKEYSDVSASVDEATDTLAKLVEASKE